MKTVLSEANVAFMTQKMTIEAPEEEMERIVKEATAIAKKVESEVEVRRIK